VITGATLQSTGVLVTRIAEMTGQSSAEIINDFAQMQNGVARWAEDHNKRFSFVTAAQWEHINALEEQGKKAEATQAVLDALTKSLGTQEQNLGYVERGWRH